MQLSVTGRNDRLAVIATRIGADATLEIRSGAMPANCAAADAGTLLAEIELPSAPFGTPSNGVMQKAGDWEGTGGAGAGSGTQARHFRIKAGGACELQGLCAQTWAASTAYAVGQQVSNGGNVYLCTTAGTSASSGGPTGTGTGITDGTAAWSYAGPALMTMFNTNIANGQEVVVDSFQLTEGNA